MKEPANHYNWENGDVVFPPEVELFGPEPIGLKGVISDGSGEWEGIIDFKTLKKQKCTKDSLDELMGALRKRKSRINGSIWSLNRELRMAKNIDFKKVDDYQKLNEEFRAVKIYEANLLYLRNML